MENPSLSKENVSQSHPLLRERLPWQERWKQFVETQQQNRFLWTIVSLVIQCCAITPAVLGLIFYTGASLPLILLCVAAVMLVFITNLALTPLTILFPALALSIVIDVSIILICLGKLIF